MHHNVFIQISNKKYFVPLSLFILMKKTDIEDTLFELAQL